jgi:hypothetical protein
MFNRRVALARVSAIGVLTVRGQASHNETRCSKLTMT